MKLKSFLAAAMSAAILASSALSAVAYAENTTTVVCAYEAKSGYTKWDGVSKLKSGKKYRVSEALTVSSDFTVPANTMLVVQKGGKLTVDAGAKVTVKGTLIVNKGATLTLNGSLNLKKGKTLTCYGKMKLGKTAKLTLNGEFDLRDTGTLSGSPKSVTVGTDSLIRLYGTNKCTKLDAAVTAAQEKTRTTSAKKVTAKTVKKEATSLYGKFLNYIVDHETLYACQLAYPNEVWRTTLDESKFAAFGGLEQFARDYSISLSNTVLSTYTNGKISNSEKVESVEVEFGDFIECINLIDDDTHAVLNEKIGDIDNLWAAEATITFTMTNGEKITMSNFYVSFTYIDKQLYVATENYFDVQFS